MKYCVEVYGATPAATDRDILLRRNYYFHVSRDGGGDDSTGNVPYPIVPSFAHFQFPPNLDSIGDKF